MSDSTTRDQPKLKERIERLCEEMIDKGILFSEASGQFEQCFIAEVVRRHDGNVLRAAEELGIHRNTLTKRLAIYSRRRGK